MHRAFLFTILIGLASRMAASAEPPTVPIALNDCHFAAFTTSAHDSDINTPLSRALWVDFRNTGTATITSLTFDAVRNGQHLVITDKGRFTPGATVTHELVGYATPWTGDDWNKDSCKAVAAEFADGTTAEY
jgi:hypothetical protein